MSCDGLSLERLFTLLMAGSSLAAAAESEGELLCRVKRPETLRTSERRVPSGGADAVPVDTADPGRKEPSNGLPMLLPNTV